MGRTTWREKADEARKIEMAWLRKNKAITPWTRCYSGSITWTSSWNDSKNSISYDVVINESDQFFRTHYTITDRFTQEKRSIDYKVRLTKTCCNYGSFRYWFTCPFSVRDVYCGRRVANLYLSGDYFMCRDCADLTYSSRCVNERMRLFDKLFRADEMREKIRTPYYKGKPTRKMRSYLRRSLNGF